MTKGVKYVFELLGLCLILMSFCSGQKGSSDPSSVVDLSNNRSVSIRPRIFQRGLETQSPQLVISSRLAGEITAAGFRLASSEEVEGMEQTLERYSAAFDRLSLPEVRQVWPSLDRQHEKAFKSVFAAFRETAWSRSLGLECAAPKVTGETASVECLETLTYGKPKGKSKQAGPNRIAILLKGQSSNWVIADMKGAN